MFRQETFGSMLSKRKAENIVDIGAYYNPINLFLDSQHCPASIVIVEPILQAVSAFIPCQSDKSKKTHVLILPVTFKLYKNIIKKYKLPRPDSVVCIGCDSVYGPNRRLLETTFSRPFVLFLEFPSEYYHNGAFRKMLGNGPGEKMIYTNSFQPTVNITKYQYPQDFEKQKLNLRSMKVIEYS